MCELYNLFTFLCNTNLWTDSQLCFELFSFNKKITNMPILTVLIVLVVAGVLLWLVNTYIPMQRTLKTILNVVVVIIVIVWLLKVFGLLTSLQNFRI